MMITDPVLEWNLIYTALEGDGLCLFCDLFGQISLGVDITALGSNMKLFVTDFGEHYLPEDLPRPVGGIPGVLLRRKVGEHQKLDRANDHVATGGARSW